MKIVRFFVLSLKLLRIRMRFIECRKDNAIGFGSSIFLGLFERSLNPSLTAPI